MVGYCTSVCAAVNTVNMCMDHEVKRFDRSTVGLIAVCRGGNYLHFNKKGLDTGQREKVVLGELFWKRGRWF